ncbi:TPA: DedA family protein [Legionella pneumophila]|nr:DedA family protein [Legionella pneumophila]HCJ1134111.1 DedA family protein [Legionella pneumophila]HCJ4217886.1 DedA family protein [Legionella pneumophila]HCJ4227303.1 DedA family protein [Legionella pneumophila]HEL9655696.1 DedA family protein [Legionella pneumophila]
MQNIQHLIDYILHIDVYLNAFVSTYGFWTYLALFAVIFCETGLIVTPFLPGDSLLFAAGSIAAQPGNPMNIMLLFALLFMASILGNQVNFLVGRAIGPRVFSAKRSWLLNPKHLHDTHAFYEKHGGKTIILARFIPIIRTFAPFIAGIGRMRSLHFTLFNLISAILWIGSLLSLGYYLGSIPLIKENFSLVIYGVIAISILPPIIALINKKSTSSIKK